MKAYRLKDPILYGGRAVGGLVVQGPIKLDVDHSVPAGLLVANRLGSLEAADHRNLDHADRILGVSCAGGIAVSGEFELDTTVDVGARLYVGQGGLLTHEPPPDGFQQQVAVAIEGQRVLLSVGTAIVLAG